MDASNLLKPLLARGELRCIGATTLKEYKLYIQKDKVCKQAHYGNSWKIQNSSIP